MYVHAQSIKKQFTEEALLTWMTLDMRKVILSLMKATAS